ncbi:Crp/Fnr family transcriptional regulator [Chryseobacterium shandongense]|uniref:Crp/Fnr family transcriptional regulator n=1 Tax=Chryseobacterium shandongense TaxID=1493872 RepID=A0AAD0YDF1_9FLAO|nr:Crp/Fnr family transcriptional regulator [Chryseobacterium shandongense]AZA85493.1 Crp/Fnr family transcriptional regulator [Chryseobacterium shandongense]AZA97665.1 Crp/Fnr family transcriptional regulator [Chryseobacterium shandongense]
MASTIIDYVSKYSKFVLEDEEIKIINSYFDVVKLKKKELLLEAGNINRYYCFIVHGAIRQYFICEKGIEHTIKLALENWWVGDMESFITKKTSMYNIQAWEDTELYAITFLNFKKLIKESPAFAEAIIYMEESNAISAQFRLNAYKSLNARQRYIALLQRYPDLYLRFPSHIIASFIGIQKETFSRIKKTISEHKVEVNKNCSL